MMFDEDRTIDKVEPNRKDFRVFRPMQFGTSKGIVNLNPGDFIPPTNDVVLYNLWQADEIRLTSEFPPEIKYKKHHKPRSKAKPKPKEKSDGN